jgi:hypothetical protein
MHSVRRRYPFRRRPRGAVYDASLRGDYAVTQPGKEREDNPNLANLLGLT